MEQNLYTETTCKERSEKDKTESVTTVTSLENDKDADEVTAEPNTLKNYRKVIYRARWKTDRDETKAMTRAQKEYNMEVSETIKIAETEKDIHSKEETRKADTKQNKYGLVTNAQQDDATVAIHDSKAETRNHGSVESRTTVVNNKRNGSSTITNKLSSYDKNGLRSTRETDTENHKSSKIITMRTKAGNSKFSTKQNQEAKTPK